MERSRERRIATRLLCAEMVEIIWRDAAGRERRRIANMEDISLSGLCLQVEVPLLPNTPVEIQCGDEHFQGTVRYSTPRQNAYFLGIQLDPNSLWDEAFFKPSHLLDPREVLRKPLAGKRPAPRTSIIQ